MTLPQASENEQLPIVAQVAVYKDVPETINLVLQYLAIKTHLLPALISQAVLYKASWKKVNCIFPRGFHTPNKRPLLQLAVGILKAFTIAPSHG